MRTYKYFPPLLPSSPSLGLLEMGSLDPTSDSYENHKTTKPYDKCDHTERFSVSTDVELEEIQVKGVSGGDNGDNVPLSTVLLSKSALRRLKEREKLERFEDAVERIDFLVRRGQVF